MARARVVVAACCFLLAGDDGDVATRPAPHVTRSSAHAAKLPLRFEANAGQWDERVRFAAHRGGATLLIGDDGMTVGLGGGAAVTMKLVGATPSVPRGEDELVTKSNFFLGSDVRAWRSNVPNYGRVRARGWLPGVDVVWRGGGDGLEYDLEVAPGVDARDIVLDVDGATRLEVAADGSLDFMTTAGTLVQKPPRVVQDGRELPTRYVRASARRVRFAIDGYDRQRPVLIDPPLAYSSYLGASEADDGAAIAVDASGNAYVTGSTSSLDFPTKNALQPKSAGGYGEVFVTKLNAAGTALVYSTYLGGSSMDEALGIAVDASGDVYVTGDTQSTNFPTQGPIQAAHASDGGIADAFVSELDATGSTLVYSTYLGGGDLDIGRAIAVDASGNAYVTGVTWSTDFPTHAARQGALAGGGDDAFVAKLNAGGSALVYSTFLGGTGVDYGTGVAADASGNAYVTGGTQSSDFPTKNGIQAAQADNAFVTKLSADGSTLVYSTYLGGTGSNAANGIALDASDDAYVTGYTSSTDFPTTQGAFQATYGGSNFDAFVTELNPAGDALVYSTYLGASGDDRATGIAVDGSGDACVIGTTGSSDFPTLDASQAAFAAGYYDAFVTELNPAGSALVYSTYLGGVEWDEGAGVAVDAAGNAYVTGRTYSPDFPGQGGVQATHANDQGQTDAYVTKLGTRALGAPCTDVSQCDSGYCVDGVCCDTACTDQCAACDVTGEEGTCSPVTGAPHGSRTACNGTGACAAACGGVDTTQCTYPGASTSCGSTCAAGVETDEACDGKGGCAPGATHSCNDFACAPDGTRCNTTCSLDTDCAAGFTCTGGACVPASPGATCVDDHTAQTGGSTKDCSPYTCENGCKTSCASDSDCVAPDVCSAGQCVPPSSSSSGGCSCSAGADGSAPWATGLLAFAIASVLRRKRRAASAP